MVTKKTIVKAEKRKKERMTLKDVGIELYKNKFLYAMAAPAIIWVIIFCYLPMVGVIIAFKDFNMMDGIFGSKWVGFENFKFLFNYKDIGQITFNTLYLNILFLVSGTATSVILAIMFTEIKNKFFNRLSQSVAILPHFVSWAVVSMFLIGFLTNNGMINQLITTLGGKPIDFYADPRPWRIVLVILKIWQGAGFGSVVYVAAITGFDTSLYEAARIDGANKFQQITRLTLPMLKPTIILLTIMGVGGIFKGDFGMIYALVGDNSMLYPTIDVIDTFSYRALRQLNDLGMSTATSLFQSVVGMVMVVGVNAIARKVEAEAAIF